MSTNHRWCLFNPSLPPSNPVLLFGVGNEQWVDMTHCLSSSIMIQNPTGLLMYDNTSIQGEFVQLVHDISAQLDELYFAGAHISLLTKVAMEPLQSTCSLMDVVF